MKALKRIALTELQVMFYSPIAWFILVIFLFQVVMAFDGIFSSHVATQEMNRGLYDLTQKVYTNPMVGLFARVQGYLYLYIPLLTMGIMSRELNSGSIKLLYSSPVTNFQIIVGKYIAVVVYALLMVFVVSIFVIYGAFTIDNFDLPPCLVGLLGLFLLICAYGAIGLFMSSLTIYQVIAAIGTFTILAVLKMVGGMWQDIPFVRDIMFWLAISGRVSEFVKGLLCSEDVIYFLMVISMFIGFTVVRLKCIREKKAFSKSFGMYLAVVAVTVVVGYVTSRPSMMSFYDATRFERNTLTPSSREIVDKLEGDLTITTYANILDEPRYVGRGLLRNELKDIQRFTQYTRFKPEIEMKYVRYFAKGNNEKQLDRQFPLLNDRERMGVLAKNYRVDSASYIDLEQVSQLEDLSGENYRFVRSIERENGQKTFLRIFNDSQVDPSEAEITAALKRLVMKLPLVGFVEGHGERNCVDMNDHNYAVFAQEKTFRQSLINQGFDFMQVNLDQPVPDDVTILVLADMRSAMSEEQERNLEAYLERGGNMLIAGEARRQEFMNPILAKFGVSLLPGRLVCPTANFPQDLVAGWLTNDALKFSHHFFQMFQFRQVVTMPSATALDFSGAQEKGFDATVLLVADTVKRPQIWSEVETTNFVDDTAKLNPAVGEKLYTDPIPLMVALSREINGKEQKIMVLGDADCLSTGGLNRRYRGMFSSNYSLINVSFFWLSDEEAPVDIRRPASIDNKLFVDLNGFMVTKVIFMGVIPFALLLFAILLWLRRKGR